MSWGGRDGETTEEPAPTQDPGGMTFLGSASSSGPVPQGSHLTQAPNT